MHCLPFLNNDTICVDLVSCFCFFNLSTEKILLFSKTFGMFLKQTKLPVEKSFLHYFSLQMKCL